MRENITTFDDAVQQLYHQSAKDLFRFYILKYMIRLFLKSLTASSNLAV